MPGPGIEPIGRVYTYFALPGVASVRLEAPLRVGDRIYVRGRTTDFQHIVESLQIDHAPVTEAQAGQLVGVRVPSRCRRHDVIFRLRG